MEVLMVIDITRREEELLELLGVPWNGWQYEQQNFAEINFELEANGVPTYKSFEEYLEGRLEYKQRIAA
jgi:hypothetical protein